jgi:hypothetical protein
MQYLSISLALAAAASAIDIRAYHDIPRFSHCEGQYLVSWLGVAANTCYSTSTSMYAMKFDAIPSTWHLVTRSYGALNCPSNQKLNEFHSDGRTWVCHGSPDGSVQYRGAGYSFVNKKRSDDANSNDQDCVGPDLVHLIDGRNYTVTNVEAKIVQEMVSL